MIKKYDDGKLTPFIFSLKNGDKLAMKGPIRKWNYKRESVCGNLRLLKAF
jgi:cytochrome-b5 reductase